METILLIDDELGIRETIQAYGEKDGFRMYCAKNGEEGLRIFASEKIDLLILDWMLPDISGPEIIKKIRVSSTIPILMISARGDEGDIILGLDLGADDYVRKPFGPREVIARAKALLRRRKETPSHEDTILTIGELRINLTSATVQLRTTSIALTPNEFRILEELGKHPGRVYSRNELMSEALGYHGYVSDRTLDTHIKNLRKKIEEDPAHPQIIQTVRERGYKLTIPPVS